jgi:transposase
LVRISAAPGDDRWKTEAARISKRGNGYLRMLLIHGARTALLGLAKKDTPLGRWVKALLARAHRNVVTVALANKLARIAWTVLARDRWYVAVQTAANSGGRGKGREV